MWCVQLQCPRQSCFSWQEMPLQGAEPERADSKVLSDEEVEEAEASDSFPALGYPAGIGSIGSGEALAGPHL